MFYSRRQWHHKGERETLGDDAPGNTLQGGDTRTKNIFYMEHGRN